MTEPRTAPPGTREDTTLRDAGATPPALDGRVRHPLLRTARRVVTIVIGSALVVAGVAMMMLPGPGLVTVAAGLAVLAREFRWARRLLARVRDRLRTPDAATGGVHRDIGPAGPGSGHPTL